MKDSGYYWVQGLNVVSGLITTAILVWFLFSRAEMITVAWTVSAVYVVAVSYVFVRCRKRGKQC